MIGRFRIARAAAQAALLLLAACRGAPEIREGYVPVQGGRVWYRIVGADRPGTPLLLVHGGPGTPSDYLEPLGALADERPVIFYDQLGTGRSSRATDSTHWTVPRFTDELAAVRQAVAPGPVHLYGHSWGAVLVTELLLREPRDVRSATFASPVFSVRRWRRDADSLRALLSSVSQRAFAEADSTGNFESKALQVAEAEYLSRFVWRGGAWPEALLRATEERNIYQYLHLWGPKEWKVIGTLRDYERLDALPRLALPVLLTAGRYDEATPAAIAEAAARLPQARTMLFERSAHLAMLEEPAAYVKTLRRFLADLER